MIRSAARGRRAVISTSVLVTALAASAGPVSAQLLQDVPTVVVPTERPINEARSVFARMREIGVADRMLPAFTAQGVTVGAFDVFPGLSVGSLYTSNLFANNDDRKGDVAVVVRPEVTVRTSAGPYQVSSFVRGDLRRYAGHASENTEEGQAGVEGSVAVGPLSSLTAGVSYGSLINPRFASDSPAQAAKPVEYKETKAFGGGTIEGASMRIVLRGEVVRLRFRDTPSKDGGVLFTRDRDRTRVQGLVRVERAVGPGLSVYVAGSVNKVDYRLATPGIGTRDSKGYGVYVGSSFEAGTLLRGDVRVGYIHQKFDLANVRRVSGLGALGTLVYFPNRLSTISATVESSVQDSGVPGTTGFLHRGGSIRGDHELRRYLIASIEGGYFRDTYRGLPRRDRLPFADIGLTYLSRNHWNARAGYRYLARDCSCSAGISDYDDHRVSLTMTIQN